MVAKTLNNLADIGVVQGQYRKGGSPIPAIAGDLGKGLRP